MTSEQYERWQDFATRMARVLYAGHRRPAGGWILRVVKDWFDGLDSEDIPCIVNWDHSEPYPEGSGLYRKTFRARCWHCSKTGNDPDECRYGCEGGLIYDYATPYGCGDMMSEFLDGWRPARPRCRACYDYRHRDEGCRCDEIEDRFYDQWDEQWGGPVRCCIRAGLDLASAPSAGVVGFTLGDLRRMYPEGLPDWIARPYGDPWVIGPIGESGTPVNLADLPDSREIWL